MQYKLWVHFAVVTTRDTDERTQELITRTVGWKILTVDHLPESDADILELQTRVASRLWGEGKRPPFAGKVLLDNWKVLGHVVQEEELL